MKARLDMTDEERKARRAEQSRLCRAKKTGTTPKAQALVPTPVDDALVAAIKAATADLETYRPLRAREYSAPDLDLEDGTVLMVAQGIEDDFDIDKIRQDFLAWKQGKDWHDVLRIAVHEVQEPNTLPAVQYYIAT
jgi:hypothetical protein